MGLKDRVIRSEDKKKGKRFFGGIPYTAWRPPTPPPHIW